MAVQLDQEKMKKLASGHGEYTMIDEKAGFFGTSE
jgi:hypothetical protein